MSPTQETNRESPEAGTVGKFVNSTRIYELMSEQGYNKEQLARRTNLGRSTIDRVLGEPDHDPSISTMIAIAFILRTTVDDIVNSYTP